MAKSRNINASGDDQSLYPPNSRRRTVAAVIIAVIIIGAGIWAFSYLLG